MNNHLGKIEISQNCNRTDLIFHKVNSLFFQFDDYSFLVSGNIIKNISITPTGNIILELVILDVNLYNSYVCEDNITSITEVGTAFNIENKGEEMEYKTSYKNYRFKTMSGGKPEVSDWIFVLEKID